MGVILAPRKLVFYFFLKFISLMLSFQRICQNAQLNQRRQYKTNRFRYPTNNRTLNSLQTQYHNGSC